MKENTEPDPDVYIDVVRKFLGLESNDLLLELFGEFWVNHVLGGRPTSRYAVHGLTFTIEQVVARYHTTIV